MDLNETPWLNQAYQQLTEPFNQARAHHALLINHIQGIGEDKLILHFIMRMLCQTPTTNQPCHQCHHCQLFLSKNHPDYYQIEPEKNKSSIGIDQIRHIVQKIYEHAQQGGFKIIWIKNASSMTEAAANALLKTLEEPSQNTYFILTTNDNKPLLPTIRSRCSSYTIELPTLDELVNWLKNHQQLIHQNYNDNELATALLLNKKAPFLALSLLEQQKWQLRQQFCHSLNEHFNDRTLWGLKEIFLKDEMLIEKMNWFCSFLTDVIKAKQKSGKFIVNRDQVSLIRLIAKQDLNKIFQLYMLWNETQTQLLTITSLNEELLICNLLGQSEILLY